LLKGVVGIQYFEDYAKLNAIEVIDRELPCKKLKGLYVDRTVVLKPGMSSVERCCILAEELGHYATSKGNIVDYRVQRSRDQEHLARFWACERLITFRKLQESCCRCWPCMSALASFWNISDEFLRNACACFKKEYGCELLTQDNEYRISLNPFSVAKAYVDRLELIDDKECKYG
jgi:hypothetical protein